MRLDLRRIRHRLAKQERRVERSVKNVERCAGVDAGRAGIPVGLAKVLRIASRAVPGLFLKIINTKQD